MVGMNPEQVLSCLRDVIGKLDEIYHDRMHGQGSELRVLVHASHAGAIIGRAGFKIKELREECGTEIKVFSDRAPYSTDRCIRINGSCEDVVETVNRVLQIVHESPIKGPDQPYDSSNYDPSMVEAYGGFPMDGTWRGGGGPPMGGGRPMGGPPPGGRMGGFPDEEFRGGGRGGPPGGMRGGGGGGPPGGGFGAGRGGGGPSPMFGGGPQSTTQVTIPDQLAGVVIGKGGQRIADTRNRSGAEISIDSKANEQNERIITITGTQNAIQMAQYLLQQTVRASSVGRQYIQEQLGGS